MPSPKTINDLYSQGFESHPQVAAFRRRVDGSYEDVSTAAFERAGAEVALGLMALGIEREDRVAVLSETRIEWALVDYGILTAGAVSVPVYPTVTAKTVSYVLQDSAAKLVFASGSEQTAKLDEYRAKNPDAVVVVFDGPAPEGAHTLDDLRERGRGLGEKSPGLHTKRAASVEPGDLATLIYTSGTTGTPKGVMLTHENIAANVAASLEVLGLRPDDTCLSFLPLSHILERMAGLYCMVYSGVTIAYAESVDTVAENMLEVRPTVMVSVPRLYEKIYGRVLDAAMRGGFIKKNLFFWARRVGLERARLVLAGKKPGFWLNLQYGVARKLVFAKLKKRTGGRLRFFVSGGAPLAQDIAEFFYAAGLPILEGYGLTESSPVLAVNTFGHLRPGTVGRPIPGVEIKIAEDGEILAKGPNIMKGYYNLPEETAAALQDGWLYTGDIGHLDEGGYLVITDRKKDLIVTAGGKNVAPQPIENDLRTDRFMTEAVVIGDRRPYLVALIVPNFGNLAGYLARKGVTLKDPAALVRHPDVQALIRKRIARHQRHAASFETVKYFHLLDRELSIERGELTPTLKVKRKEVEAAFKDEIEALYAQ